MMKSIFSALAFVVVAAFAAPTYADATGTGIGTGIAGADASVNMGDILSFGSAAAACANNVGPVSWSDSTCERVMLAEYWAKRGNVALADEIVLGDAKVKAAVRSLSDKKAASAAAASEPAVSSKSDPADDGMRDTFWLDGTQYRLTTKSQIAAFNACQPVHVPKLGVHVKMDGC